jgi:hypothetical protein
MKIELPLIEIEDYIKDNYGVDVKIKFADFNKIEVEYLFGIQIQVVEFTDYTVRFSYDLNWAANLIAKMLNFLQVIILIVKFFCGIHQIKLLN